MIITCIIEYGNEGIKYLQIGAKATPNVDFDEIWTGCS